MSAAVMFPKICADISEIDWRINFKKMQNKKIYIDIRSSWCDRFYYYNV